MQSIVQLSNDDAGEEDTEGNVVQINAHFDEKTGKFVTEPLVLSLPADSFRDRIYMDWLLSNKDEQSTTVDDYNDLMHRTFV